MNPGVSRVLASSVPRLDGLTGLRWWAAFLVFLFHMRVFAPLPDPLTRVFDMGYLGVTFFFVLSGFVLTWSMRPTVRLSTFYWRRFARIWPAHMVALLFAIPVFYTVTQIPEGSFLKPLDLGVLFLSVLLLQGWWANPAILFSGNPAAWTLTVEALFYALHPLISRVLVLMRKRGALILVFAAIVWAFSFRAALTFLPEIGLHAVPMPITRVPEFLVGMGLAWAMRNGWRPRLPVAVGIGLLGLAAAGMLIGAVRPAFWPLATFGNEIFTLAVGAAIVAVAARSLGGRQTSFESRWQVTLGLWSFSFYLVHATVIYLALRVFGYQEQSWRNLLWFGMILAVDLVLAWALYRWIEHPVERRMRRWKDDRDARKVGRTDASARVNT